MQKDANLVELEKCCRTHTFLQKFVLIQLRTSPPKIAISFAKFANFANPNLGRYAAVMEYWEQLQPMCIAKPEPYAERKKRREAEIAGLKDALLILEEESGSEALLQATAGVVRGRPTCVEMYFTWL